MGRTLAPLRHGRGDPTIRFEPAASSGERHARPRDPHACVSRPAAGWLAGHGLGTGQRARRRRRCRGCWGPRTTRPRSSLPAGPLRELSATVPATCASGAATPSWPRSCRPSSSRRSPAARRSAPGARSCSATASRRPDRAACTCRRSRPSLRALPYFELHPLGLEQRRAVTLIRAAERADWLEEATRLAARGRHGPPPDRSRRRSLDGGRDGPRRARRSRRREPRRLPHARASCAGRWPASRAATTRACSSSSSPTAASEPASSGCSSSRALQPPRYGPRYAGRSIAAL